MNRGWRLSSVLLSFACLGLGRAAAEPAEPGLRVRVLSWNVWGVPHVSSRLEARMRALPKAILSQRPDLVVLQELWESGHAASVSRALAAQGYFTHAIAGSFLGGTGLFVASKWPLTSVSFQPFRVGRLPHSLWHLDWMVSKGVGSFLVDTPLGGLLLEDTHLQAQYVTDTYDGERLAQASELALLNRKQREVPLVLAGDFNSGDDELPRRALSGLDLVDAYPRPTTDTVYVREGRSVAVRVLDARLVLGESRPLDDGAPAPLSDHLALRVDLELVRSERSGVPFAATASTRRVTVAALKQAGDITSGRVARALLASLAALGLAVVCRRSWVRSRLQPRLERTLVRAGLALLALGFVWSFYLGTIYYPTRGSALREITRELEEAFRAPSF